MSNSALRIIGIIGLILSAVLVFVAIERYQSNAANVRAINAMRQSSPLMALGGAELKPATPAATKYALVFAAVFGAGGIVAFVVANKPTSQGPNITPPEAGAS